MEAVTGESASEFQDARVLPLKCSERREAVGTIITTLVITMVLCSRFGNSFGLTSRRQGPVFFG